MLNLDYVYVILFSLPIYQLLFYTVQLITFKRTSPSRRYLGFLMLAMTVFLIFNALYRLGYDWLFSWVYFIFIPVLLAIAPIYFLYILSLTREDHDVKARRKLIFFIPPVLMFLLNLFTYGLLPAESRLAFIQAGLTAGTSGLPGLKVAEVLFWFGSVGLLAFQLVVSGYQMRKILLAEDYLMRQRPAYLAYLNWNWVLIISVSVGIFLIFNGLLDVVIPPQNIVVATIHNAVMLITGGVAGFYGMKQNSLMLQVSKMTMPKKQVLGITEQEPEDNREEVKIADFIQEEEAEKVRARLIALMEERKPYLSAEFSMGDLCVMLEESRRKVTYVINDYMDKNFYGIVNDYRIKEAVEMLSADKHNHLKIEVIAEMVGFQSKSSFNACFKKYTGQTPSAFKLSQVNHKVVAEKAQ
jgi:AraC-like DNA-binding protein